MNQSVNQLMTEVFVEQPLASPGSAYHILILLNALTLGLKFFLPFHLVVFKLPFHTLVKRLGILTINTIIVY